MLPSSSLELDPTQNAKWVNQMIALIKIRNLLWKNKSFMYWNGRKSKISFQHLSLYTRHSSLLCCRKNSGIDARWYNLFLAFGFLAFLMSSFGSLLCYFRQAFLSHAFIASFTHCLLLGLWFYLASGHIWRRYFERD